MEPDVRAGNYLGVIGDARLKASEAMVSQGATVFGGALLTPVAASIGSAATVQARFWGGVGAQTSTKAAQVAGAHGLIHIQIASVDFPEGLLVLGVPPSSRAGLFGFFFNQAIEDRPIDGQ